MASHVLLVSVAVLGLLPYFSAGVFVCIAGYAIVFLLNIVRGVFGQKPSDSASKTGTGFWLRKLSCGRGLSYFGKN